MPEPPESNEPMAPEYDRQAQGAARSILPWLIIGGYALIVFRGLWGDEYLQLAGLHYVIRMSQSLAKLFGSIALNAENAYNEYVSSLH